MVWFSFGGAPVPSMTRTWFRTIDWGVHADEWRDIVGRRILRDGNAYAATYREINHRPMW